MNKFEDFIIDKPYQLTAEDEEAIKKASPNEKDGDHWTKSCLDGFKRHIKDYLKKNQNECCAYCRMELHENEASPEIEHIVPKDLKADWMYTPLNLCLSCKLCNTKKGPQITMRLHTRITEGDDKGYIATSDAIWPRAYALDQDLELLRSSSIKDLMLRFGQKTVPVLDENGEPVKDENGEVMTELAWGSPKWVAWFDGQDWHELLGAKVLFDDQSDVAPEEDEEDFVKTSAKSSLKATMRIPSFMEHIPTFTFPLSSFR